MTFHHYPRSCSLSFWVFNPTITMVQQPADNRKHIKTQQTTNFGQMLDQPRENQGTLDTNSLAGKSYTPIPWKLWCFHLFHKHRNFDASIPSWYLTRWQPLFKLTPIRITSTSKSSIQNQSSCIWYVSGMNLKQQTTSLFLYANNPQTFMHHIPKPIPTNKMSIQPEVSPPTMHEKLAPPSKCNVHR